MKKTATKCSVGACPEPFVTLEGKLRRRVYPRQKGFGLGTSPNATNVRETIMLKNNLTTEPVLSEVEGNTEFFFYHENSRF